MTALEDFVKNYTRSDVEGISIIDNPDVSEFLKLIDTDKINIFDGKSHSYIDIIVGKLCGRVDIVLRFMALGAYFDVWEFKLPNITIRCTEAQIDMVNKINKFHISKDHEILKNKILEYVSVVLDERIKCLPRNTEATIKADLSKSNGVLLNINFLPGL